MSIYMDTAASTMPSSGVIETMNNVVGEYANPSSMHQMGIRAREIIDNASDIISKQLNCKPSELYYTSGATMSNCVAIQGWMRRNPDGVLIISEIEHNDIMDMAKYLKEHGRTVIHIPVDKNGMICYNHLIHIMQTCKKDKLKFLVSIQLANSETGIIQNELKTLIELIDFIHKYGGIFHTDATQYIPHYPIDVSAMKIDMMSMSGQKINCIKGTGLLYVKDDIEIDPIIFGEQGLVGGTENVVGIACLGTAFSELRKNKYSHIDELRNKRNHLASELLKIGGKIVGMRNNALFDNINHLPNNVAVIFDGIIRGENMVQFLSEKGIYVSSGSACSSYVMKPSHVLKAMGYTDEEASSCVRFTIDNNTITYEDIDYVIQTIKQILLLLK